jgi:hypothetical protein
VSFAAPVGRAPAGRVFLDRRISRAGFFAAAGVLAALNAQADQIINILTVRWLTGLFVELGGISAIIWFAMYAALKIGIEGEAEPIRRRDLAVVGIAVFLSFIPLFFAAKGAVLLSGFYLLATSRPGSSSRRVALILLALTGPLVWGRVLLNVFAAPILALDAHIVGSLIGFDVRDNVIGSDSAPIKYFIGGGCSSVHNISIAILLWATAAALFKIRLDRRYLGVGALMVVWMFLLNIVRLSLLGLFPQHFDYIHVGGGAVLFAWFDLIGAALLAGFGVIRAAERQQ